METEHTPTPWVIHPEMGRRFIVSKEDAAKHLGGSVHEDDDKARYAVIIAEVSHNPLATFKHKPTKERAQANAQFIVDAVNNHDRYKAALEAITNIAGNLTDEAVEAVGGVNDARSRALMVITARQIAKNALANKESEQAG